MMADRAEEPERTMNRFGQRKKKSQTLTNLNTRLLEFVNSQF